MIETKEIVKKETDGLNNTMYGYYDSDNNFRWHRDEKDGPAVFYKKTGTKVWALYGKFHRENGPAVIRTDGEKAWWINNIRHREDGPAMIFSDGTTEWWYNDKIISNEVNEWLNERNIDSDNMTEEDKLALTFFMRSLI